LNDSGDFKEFSAICEAIRATSSRLEKLRIAADYFRRLSKEALVIAARFLAGYIFPRGTDLEVNVGYSLIAEVLKEVSGASEEALRKTYLKYGDLGFAAEELLEKKAVRPLMVEQLTLKGVYQQFERMAHLAGPRSTSDRATILKGLLLSASPLEARYVIKILTGELRIGFVEGMVEEGLAKAFNQRLEDVRTAALVLGDVGETARLAAENRLREARLQPLRPTNFMLADVMQTAQEIASYYRRPLYCEFKYDGIRVQAHRSGGEVRLYSRNLEEIGRSFPEIIEALRRVDHDFIMDGELVPVRAGRPLPFHHLQHRLRRKRPDPELIGKVPVTLYLYDLLYLDGQSLINAPLKERRRLLEALPIEPPLALSQLTVVRRAEEIAAAFDKSRELGYEGLVLKDPASNYRPGRRGKNWVKLKRELETLDVVVVAAEYGHGKRAGVLSDYTFAVRDGDELRVVGKAYTGLTDQEIAWMTRRLKELAIRDFGHKLLVKPVIVLEVAFDAIQRSDRHDSGFALRFPRIKRIREDKGVHEIDTLERVRAIYEAQQVR
jgi:DNA ligase-1